MGDKSNSVIQSETIQKPKQESIFNKPGPQKTTMNSEVTQNTETTAFNSKIEYSSRVSRNITQSLLEKEKCFLKNPNDYDKIIQEESDSIISDDNLLRGEIILKESIRVSLLVIQENREIIKTINMNITNKITIFDLIKESVVLFNKIFDKENLTFYLDVYNLQKYTIKPSKKTGKPDLDMPKLSNYSYVSDTNVKKLSLICEDDALIIMKRNTNFFEKCLKCVMF